MTWRVDKFGGKLSTASPLEHRLGVNTFKSWRFHQNSGANPARTVISGPKPARTVISRPIFDGFSRLRDHVPELVIWCSHALAGLGPASPRRASGLTTCAPTPMRKTPAGRTCAMPWLLSLGAPFGQRARNPAAPSHAHGENAG